VLYINRGTGTTAGMNAGLTVSQSNVQVIGSGTDFVYDAGRFYAPVEDNFSGTVLVAAGAAPVITNAGVNGDGINVTGANAWIGGVTVNGSTRYGIYALASAGVDLENITVHDVTVSSNGQYGIWFSTTGAGARIGEATIRDVTASNNGDRGALVSTAAAATIETVTVDNLVSHDSVGDHGIEISADGAGSSITNIRVSDSEFYNNSTGAYIRLTNNALLDFLELTDVNSHNNTGRGVLVHALSGADINTIEADGITGQANTVQGMEISSQGAGSSISSTSVKNSSFTGNTNVGLHVNATTTSLMNSVELEGITSSGNANRGVYVIADSGADIGTVDLDDITSTGNTGANGRGLEVFANGAGSTITGVTLENSTFTGNAAIGAHISALVTGSISTIGVSDVTASTNASQGLLVQAQSDGDIGTVTISNTTAQNNTGANGVGVQVLATGAGSTVTSAVLDNITASGNANAGIYGAGSTSGVLSSIEVKNSHATGGVAQGILFDGVGNGVITTATVRNSVASGNGGAGVSARGLTGGDIGTFVARDMTVNNNTGRGITVSAEAANSVVTSATVRDSTLSGNSGDGGVYILSQTTD
jgi:hypothetical protein